MYGPPWPGARTSLLHSSGPPFPMNSDFDVEDLKVHRIAQVKPEKKRLNVLGAPAPMGPADDVDEAFGGNTELSEVVSAAELEERVTETLRSIYDPEIPLNIFDLGLIYGVAIDGESNVEVSMTLTAPACPVAGMIVKDVAEKVGATPGVRRSHVKLVWDPPWTKERMTEDALLELGLI